MESCARHNFNTVFTHVPIRAYTNRSLQKNFCVFKFRHLRNWQRFFSGENFLCIQFNTANILCIYVLKYFKLFKMLTTSKFHRLSPLNHKSAQPTIRASKMSTFFLCSCCCINTNKSILMTEIRQSTTTNDLCSWS